jgi:hypothetical protein
MVKYNNNWICFDSFSGYSQGAFDIIRAIKDNSDFNITVDTIGRSKTIENVNDTNHINTFYCIPPFQKTHKGIKSLFTVGFAIFETFDFPDEW